jgi:hypothetical protein
VTQASSWWRGKVRQFRRHLTGRVVPGERTELAAWLTPAQQRLFDSMHPADQRHGLDVVAALRTAGFDDPDVLLAGLFHDASKGRATGVLPRVLWSLSERYGSWVLRATDWLPGYRAAFERIRIHPDQSAALAQQAGCTPLTADLIRGQAEAGATPAARALRLADEAN